ncbi:MAG: LolA family protein [Thermodesulfobacteriota bacterium]
MKRRIKQNRWRLIAVILCLVFPGTGFCLKEAALDKVKKAEAAEPELKLGELLDKIEAGYRTAGFSADFTQTSTLKAMDITDEAAGHAVFKRPGKMRWEYETPERQQIITDGKNLWIYRLDDNQVTVGTFPAFFGDGKGASFLSDMQLLRKKFHILLMGRNDGGDYILELKPMEANPDIVQIRLTVSQKTFFVYRIITFNSYGDETRIELTGIEPREQLDDAMFTFTVPDQAEVVQLNE